MGAVVDERRVRRERLRDACPRPGSSSYSTAMAATAASAVASSTAATAATGSPDVTDAVDGHDGPVLDGVAEVRVDVAARSAPVRTATTPGMASAAAVSIATMRACGSGLRRTLPWSMPGHARCRRRRPPRRRASRPRRRAPSIGRPGRPDGRRGRVVRRGAVVLSLVGAALASRPRRTRAPRPRRGWRGSPCSGRGCRPARGGRRRPRRGRRPRAGRAIVSTIAGVQKPHWSAAWRVKASAMRLARVGLAEAPRSCVTSRPSVSTREVRAGAHRQPVDEDRARAADLDVA